MVVAIFCGHPDNLEDSDESEPQTVAPLGSTTEPRAVATGSKHSTPSKTAMKTGRV